MIIRYYRWLYKWYNKVGMTAGNKVLLKNEDGTYRPAGLKGQIIGNIVVSAYIVGIYYAGKAIGREQAEIKSQNYNDALDQGATVDEWEHWAGDNQGPRYDSTAGDHDEDAWAMNPHRWAGTDGICGPGPCPQPCGEERYHMIHNVE